MAKNAIDLRKLLKKDIDDVTGWAYELSGNEEYLDLALNELAAIIRNRGEDGWIRLMAIAAIGAMPIQKVFGKETRTLTSIKILEALMDYLKETYNDPGGGIRRRTFP